MKIALILLSVILLAGCASETDSISETHDDSSAAAESIVISDNEAAQAMPEEMPDDFDISYSWWIKGKNTIDTYKNYIEKDLVTKGTETAGYYPDEAELREIYGILLEYDISGIDREMTSAVLTTDDTMMDVEPCTYYDIKFTADGNTYHVSGDATAWGYRNSDKDAEVFCAFNNEMSKFVRETDEYKALPEPEGAYE